MLNILSNLLNKYPIKSIEDPFSEDDWKSVVILHQKPIFRLWVMISL